MTWINKPYYDLSQMTQRILSGIFVLGDSDMEHSPGEVYEIIVKEPLDPSWSEWFYGFIISRTEKQETIIVGRIRDQTALHGLLAKIQNLNLTLLSVTKVVDEKAV
jgi:hypothetical protein